MEKKKTFNFSMAIMAFILAVGIYKQYDFETQQFRKIALVVVYSLSLLLSLYFLLKDYFKRA